VRRIATLCATITNGWVGTTRDILVDSGTPYIQSLHVKNGEIRFAKQYFVDQQWLETHSKVRLCEGDVVVVQTGDIGQVACVPSDFQGAGCHALIILRTNPAVVSGRFLDVVLRSKYGFDCLKRVQTGALHPHLNCTWVREIYSPVPPISEQLSILEFLGAETANIDTAITRANREIELVNEYRTRLIADVVTGKVDVREAAAALPEVDPLVANGEPDDILDSGDKADLDELEATLEED
jgi:type I restriction enzyme S subunit